MSHDEPVRKRRRPAVACLECSSRKIRCNRALPCDCCTQSSRPCVYSPAAFAQNVNTVWRPTALPQFEPVDVVDHSWNSQYGFDQPLDNGRNGDTFFDILDDATVRVNTTVAVGDPSGDGTTTSDLSCGKGHWKRFMQQIDVIQGTAKTIKGLRSPSISDIRKLWQECETQASTIRSSVKDRKHKLTSPQSVFGTLPSRSICDELFQLFSVTYGSIYTSLAGFNFADAYESFHSLRDNAASRTVVKVLLILAIGSCFLDSSKENTVELRALASVWISFGQIGLAREFDASEPDIELLQISCLLHLARQVDLVPSELIWISADLPLRVAMSLNLHKATVCDTETTDVHLRQSLWYTVLEFSLQMSLDSGVLPAVNNEAFDTLQPVLYESSSINVLSLLTQTTRTRLKISHLINSLSPEPRFQTVLRLGSELDQGFRSHVEANRRRLSPFQFALLTLINKRFLQSLHLDFAQKARSDPAFYFSRKVVVDTSVAIMKLLQSASDSHLIADENEAHFVVKLVLRDSGINSHTFWHAAARLHSELRQDQFDPQMQVTDASHRAELLKILGLFRGIYGRRCDEGDTDFLPYLSFVLLDTDLLALESEDGRAFEESTFTAASEALSACNEKLKFVAAILGKPP